MISFFLFIFWVGLSIGSFLIGLYYIQDLPKNVEILSIFHTKIVIPDFWSWANLPIGILFIIIFPIILFIVGKWYRKIIVYEIRKGFWKYLLITLLQVFSFLILYSIFSIFIPLPTLIRLAICVITIFYILFRISLYNDYKRKNHII